METWFEHAVSASIERANERSRATRQQSMAGVTFHAEATLNPEDIYSFSVLGIPCQTDVLGSSLRMCELHCKTGEKGAPAATR